MKKVGVLTYFLKSWDTHHFLDVSLPVRDTTPRDPGAFAGNDRCWLETLR